MKYGLWRGGRWGWGEASGHHIETFQTQYRDLPEPYTDTYKGTSKAITGNIMPYRAI